MTIYPFSGDRVHPWPLPPGDASKPHKVYIKHLYRGFCWARSLAWFERPTDNRKVASSNLAGPTNVVMLSGRGSAPLPVFRISAAVPPSAEVADVEDGVLRALGGELALHHADIVREDRCELFRTVFVHEDLELRLPLHASHGDMGREGLVVEGQPGLLESFP